MNDKNTSTIEDNFHIKENIYPVTLQDRDSYIYDISNIKYNMTGRTDVWLANTFIAEASKLLINAIDLFEKGYFDCAYYSLREAIEISTTMVYLSDISAEERKDKLKAWQSKENFPMFSQMLKELKEKGDMLSDMKNTMTGFFTDLQQTSKELNKFVHKQGTRFFYVVRKGREDSFLELETKEFEDYLIKCIGIVAVMRLAIDPFPILLADEEIYHRCFHGLSERLGDDFIEKYIGEDNLNSYKKTATYQTVFTDIMKKPKRLPCVSDIVFNQYIDTKKREEILPQLGLLEPHDFIATILALMCEKVTKVYAFGGIYFYLTDRESNRKSLNFNGQDFQGFANSEQKYNLAYDQALISSFKYDEENFFIEHNVPLSTTEITAIIELFDMLNSVREEKLSHYRQMTDTKNN